MNHTNKVMKDKLRTASAILCIASMGFILGITIITMILQAASGGAVLYPILALVLGGMCYHVAVKDKVKQGKTLEEIMNLDEKDGLYE